MEHQYTIPGTPGALARSGFPTKDVAEKQRQLMISYALHLGKQHEGRPFFKGPLFLDITIFYPLPKLNPERFENQPATEKPHLDDIMRFIRMSAEGILYTEGSRIAYWKARKFNDKVPRIEFTLKEINGKR